MTISMPSLKRAKNGDWLARKAIPAELRDAYQRAYGIRQEERFRVPSGKSPGEAKAAFVEWLADIESRISTLRAAASGQPLELTHRQRQELIGRWYDWFVVQHTDDADTVAAWDLRHDRYQDAVEAPDTDDERDDDKERSPRHARRVRAVVLELSRLPTFLADEGIQLTSAIQDELVAALEADLVAAMALLRRRAGGNYRADTHRDRFPQAAPIVPANGKLSGWNAWQAFEAWVNERKPATATVNRWRGVFDHLNKHLDGRDIASITDEDAVAWKDKLMNGNVSGRTVNEVWLTAARRVFNWTKAQKRISSNPFDGIKVAVGRTTATKGEFSEDDVAAILKATLVPQHNKRSPYLKAAIRWVPWLCAYTGSRPGEITQLRRCDIEHHKGGFWKLHIRPEAGAVKGGVARTVVLHEHLVEQGFIEFVNAAKDGPLFYDPTAARAQKVDDPLNPPRPMYVQVRQKLADWVRKLGVSDKGVSPNHGWRHTFKRRAARAKIEQRLRDAFCGHSAGHIGAIYELPTVEDLAEAIKDFPRYPVDTPKQP